METECTASKLEFQGLAGRRVEGRFDGGEITSDAGGVVLREVERRTGMLSRLGACFADHRRADRVEHPVERLVKQRVLGICLGYEDLNDHDELGRDRLPALLCDCADIDGARRRRASDRGMPLAGKSTPDRPELTPAAGPEARCKRTVADTAAMDALLVDLFVEAHGAPPAEIVLDVDATDDPVHGGQEGRFFSGHYDCYCHVPLYVFCGEHLLCARLRSASSDGARETVAELARIVSRIRERWPSVRIAVRGDSGFCREETMAWCEASGVGYAFGLRRNERLEAMSAASMYEARVMHEATGEPQRVFVDLSYAAHSWSRRRRVVAKAEHNGLGANPRFVATSAGTGEMDCEELHEGFPLHPRRHGEPHRGAAARHVRGPHLDGADARQPAAPVLRLVRVRADADAAPGRAGGDRTREGAVRNHPRQGARGRRPGAGQRAPGLAVVRAVVAARGAARRGARQPADDAAALPGSRAGRASPTGTAGDRACPPAGASRKSPTNTGGRLRRAAAPSVFHTEPRPGQPAKPPRGKSRGPNPVGCPANARW